MNGSVLRSFALDGKVAVVTGGLGQLGAQHARALSDAGASVSVFDLHVPDDAHRMSLTGGRDIAYHAVDVTDRASIEEAWRVRTDYLKPTRATEIRLLETPPTGWSVRDGTLTEFEPGREYTVSAYGSPGDAFPIDFTIDRLTAMGPDDVVVGQSNTESTEMSEADFRDNAKDSCGGGLFGLGAG